MPGMQSSGIGRRGKLINYTWLNKRGFCSANPKRVVKRTKANRIISVPSSPNTHLAEATESLLKLTSNKLEHLLEKEKGDKVKTKGIGKKRAKVSNNRTKVGHENVHDKSDTCLESVNASSSEDSLAKSVNAAEFSPTLSETLFDPVNIADMDLTELKGLPLAEKKRKVQQQIEEMEKQLQEPEIDDELRELLEKQDRLRQRLGSTKGEDSEGVKSAKKPSKSRRMANQSIIREIKSFNEGLNKLPSLGNIQDLLHFPDKRVKQKRTKRSKRHKQRRRHESSSDTTDSDSSSSDSSIDDDSEEDRNVRRRKGKKCTSGLYAKHGSVNLVSGEQFAHTALDEELGEREISNLPFNLLVAGELEIITSDIPKAERETRLEVLKKLAYEAEHLNHSEVLSQYVSFVRKIERGKFKWGSRRDLRSFEQQLVYRISIDNKRLESKTKTKPKLDDRTKYCLDYNRGICRYDQGHEGKLQGNTVFKMHICKQCLARDGSESSHPAKECPFQK